jgi:hypothetical protein
MSRRGNGIAWSTGSDPVVTVLIPILDVHPVDLGSGDERAPHAQAVLLDLVLEDGGRVHALGGWGMSYSPPGMSFPVPVNVDTIRMLAGSTVKHARITTDGNYMDLVLPASESEGLQVAAACALRGMR